jgi:hypothetical protein
MKKTGAALTLLLLATAMLQAQEGSRKNAIKTTFLSFITGSAKLTYERATLPRQSLELTGGIIGVGYDKLKVNPKGGLFRMAYKFIRANDLGAPLSGLYFKPEYAVSIFDYESENSGRIRSSMHTMLANVGYQRVINVLVVDGFAGAGVGFGKPTELRYHHGFIERYGWLTLTFGMKIGVAF